MDEKTIIQLQEVVQRSTVLNEDEKSLLFDLLPHWPDKDVENLIRVLSFKKPVSIPPQVKSEYLDKHFGFVPPKPPEIKKTPPPVEPKHIYYRPPQPQPQPKQHVETKLPEKHISPPAPLPQPHQHIETHLPEKQISPTPPPSIPKVIRETPKTTIPEGESIEELRRRLEDDTIAFRKKYNEEPKRNLPEVKSERQPQPQIQKLQTPPHIPERKPNYTITGGTINFGGPSTSQVAQKQAQILSSKPAQNVQFASDTVVKIDRPIIQEINQPIIKKVVGGSGGEIGDSRKTVHSSIGSLLNLETLYQLAEISPNDLRVGASFQKNLKYLYEFIVKLITEKKVLPYYAVQEFEKSLLNRIFVQTGIGLLNNDSEEREQVYKKVESDTKQKFGDNLDIDEFEAIIDFKHKLDELL